MSSQRFSELPAGVARVLACILAGILFAGCSASPTAGQAAAPSPKDPVPPKIETLYEQAVAAMAAGELTDAELDFRTFLLQNPGYPGAHVNLAILMSARGDDAAALEHVQAALELDPAHAAALNQLGMLERRQGRFLEAESAYMKAVTASPDYALAHYNLGVLNELYLQRLDVALAHYERYLEFGSGDEQVAKWVADLKRRLGAMERTANVTE